MAQKKRGNNEGSLGKRKDGRWEARVTLPDGTRRSFYGRTREEAARKLAQALRAVQEGGSLARPGRRTVGDLLDAWLQAKAGQVRPGTLASYRWLVDHHLRPRLGAVRLAALDAARIEAALAEMRRAGRSARTRIYALTLLRQACKAGVRWGWLGTNPATLAHAPKAEERPHAPAFLGPDEARRFLHAVRDDAYGPLFAFLLATGCRLGEALALRWADVDLDAGLVAITGTLRRGPDGRPERGEPKTARSRRTLVLPAVALEAFREQRRRQAAARLRAGSLWQDLGYVFTSAVGTPVDGRNARRAFKAALARAGLPPALRLHDLRHSAASLLLAQGADLRTVMEVLGHSQIGVTADVYVHLVPALKRDAAAKLDAALGGP
ncbi:MAG TPA: site-specific integrase [Dehalococcoidia bacterium]